MDRQGGLVLGSSFPHFLERDSLAGRAARLSPERSAAAAAKSLQSCPTLCDPIDGSPPGSPTPGILQEGQNAFLFHKGYAFVHGEHGMAASI